MKHRSTRDKIIAGALAVALGASGVALSACSMQGTVNRVIDNTAKTAEAGITASISEDAVRALAVELLRPDMGIAAEFYAAAAVELLKQDPPEDLVYDAVSKEFVFQNPLETSEYNPFFSDTVAVYLNSLDTAVDAVLQQAGDYADKAGNYDKSAFEDAVLDLAFRYDFKGQTPIETNFRNLGNGIYGADITLDGDQLWALFSGEGLDQLDLPTYYAFFTEEYKTTDDIKIDAKKYTNSPAVNIVTNGIIDAIAVDKNAKPASDTVHLNKDGKHLVDVVLSNGNSKSFDVILDTKAPTAKIGGKKVAEGKTIKVKKGAKLVIKEANLKSAKLGGKTIRNKAAVKRAGKLVITDKAGNTLKATVKLVK